MAELGVFAGLKKGLSSGVVVFTTTATYLPHCFFDSKGRSALLHHTCVHKPYQRLKFMSVQSFDIQGL